MKWIELSVSTPPEFVEPLSQLFHRHGHGGVAVEQAGGYNPDDGEAPPEQDWVKVVTYLPVDPSTQERRSRIDLGVRLVAHVASISPLREKELHEDDWQRAWMQHFQVLHVGKGIVIVPTWRDYEPKPTETVVELDPGMAFGTGHHPTTRMCLELVEGEVSPGMDVLDVGCGSGILCIAAAKLGARRVVGLDTDPVAAKVARSNLQQNGVSQRVAIEEGSLPLPAASPHGFDLAVANISAKVISELAGGLVETLRPGGRLIISGILAGDEDGVVGRLTSEGAAIVRSLVEGDWVTLVASVPEK